MTAVICEEDACAIKDAEQPTSLKIWSSAAPSACDLTSRCIGIAIKLFISVDLIVLAVTSVEKTISHHESVTLTTTSQDGGR